MQVAIAVLIAVFVAGGAVVSAENTLPGHALYGLKVGVSEKVRSALSFSSDAKARWAIRRAERRLEEAERVTIEASLDAATRAKLEERFRAHADRVELLIVDLEAADLAAAAEISSALQTSLETHERILVMLSTRGADAQEQPEVASLVAAVDSEGGEASVLRSRIELRMSGETSPDVRAAAEGLLRVAENKIREVRGFIAGAKARIGAEAAAQAEARLTAADAAVTDGKAKLQSGAYGAAFVAFSTAHRVAQEAKLLVEASQTLRIDVGLGGPPEEAGRPEGAGMRGEAGGGVNAGSTGTEIRGDLDLDAEIQLP